MLYMVTFTIDIPQMLAYIPYMDPMGYINIILIFFENCTNEIVQGFPHYAHHLCCRGVGSAPSEYGPESDLWIGDPRV